MRRLLFVIALLLACSAGTAAPAATAPQSNIPADWAAWFKTYCAGRPVKGHGYPTEKEFADMGGLTPKFLSGPDLKVITVREGVFTTGEDDGVTCLFRHKKVACTNGRHVAQCTTRHCDGGYEYFKTDLDINIQNRQILPELEKLHPKPFPHGVYIAPDGGDTLCYLSGHVVRCRNSEAPSGGFAVDPVFLRVESFSDAGDGWPWDGKCHSPFEAEPGAP